MDPPEAVLVWKLRQVLHSLEANAAIEPLLSRLKETRTKDKFLGAIGKSSQACRRRRE